MKKSLLLFVVAGILSLVTGSLPLSAQQEREGIGISPTTLNVNADPGETVKGQFTVLNDGTQPLRFRVYVNNFGIINEDYERDFETTPSGTSPTTWFALPGGYREIAPGVKEKIDYTITIPVDTVPQGYYAVIFAETAQPEADETGVARLKRVGSLVYLTVKGGSITKGQFLNFTSGIWYRQKTVKPAIRIQNSGNVHFDVTGEVRLKNLLGRTVGTTSFSGTLLPQTIRKFTPELTTSLPLGIYRLEGEAKFLDQTIKLGGNWIIVATPFWLGLLILVIVVWVVIVVLYVKRRARRKRSNSRRR